MNERTVEPGAAAGTTTSLGAVRDLYMTHAEKYYRRRSGQATREHLNMRAAIDRFIAHMPPPGGCPETPGGGRDADPERIRPHHVRGWLDAMANEKLSRPYCNNCLRRLKTFLRWAADMEYVTTAVYERVRLVRGLAPGRSEAIEPAPPRPPELEVIAKVLDHLKPGSVARDVLQLSKLTNMRPGELLGLTNRDVHLDHRLPRLVPSQHKGVHRGKTRVVPLVPEAIAVIERWARPLLPDDYVFPGSPSRKTRAARARAGAEMTGHYSLRAYEKAIERACERAKEERFTPYDVRRAGARRARRECGLDATQALLGHSHASTTEIYAPMDTSETDSFKAALRAAGSLRGAGRDAEGAAERGEEETEDAPARREVA